MLESVCLTHEQLHSFCVVTSVELSLRASVDIINQPSLQFLNHLFNSSLVIIPSQYNYSMIYSFYPQLSRHSLTVFEKKITYSIISLTLQVIHVHLYTDRILQEVVVIIHTSTHSTLLRLQHIPKVYIHYLCHYIHTVQY